MITWPNDLVNDIARKRSVVFLGSGVSAQSKNASGERPKTWSGLLEAAIELLSGANARKDEVRRLMRNRDYLTACEVIKANLGDQNFHRLMRQELLDPNYQPAAIHDSLIQLQSRIYATPNFDKIFEDKFGSVPHTPVEVKKYYSGDVGVVARGVNPIILKIHGTIDEPGQMIFSRADYTKARNNHRQFYEVLEALAITHTFLFVGCGFDDPDMRLILEDQAFNHPFAPPHYFVILKNSVPAALVPSYERSLNIKIIEYVGDYSQLPLEIDELVVKVNEARAEMQLNRSW